MSLSRQLQINLADLPGIEVYVPPKDSAWAGILSFTVEDMKPQAIEAALGAAGIAVRAGLHCAPWAHKWLGTLNTGGTLRVSFGYFNEIKDTDRIAQLIASYIRR